MQTGESYIGFPPLSDKSDIVTALLNDPPDVRWRVVRELFRIEEKQDREDLIQALQPCLYEVDDFRIKYRIMLALQALHRPLNVNDYVLVKKRGCLNPRNLKLPSLKESGNQPYRTFSLWSISISIPKRPI